MKWDFRKLSTVKYETNTYDISEEYKGICVITDTADVILIPSEDGKTRVVCYEETKAKHSVSVSKDGVLQIKIKDDRAWYDHIGFNYDTCRISVYIPAKEYESLSVDGKTGDVKIPKSFGFKNVSVFGSTSDVECYASVTETLKVHLSTGDIFVRDTNIGSMELKVSTGDIRVSRVDCGGKVDVAVTTGDVRFESLSCGSLFSKGSTGEITLNKVIVTGKLSIERSTGDVELERSDASEIFIKTSTGDVEGSLLSEKVFIYRTDTGDVRIPHTTSGGKCEIETSTGDIEIKIASK